MSTYRLETLFSPRSIAVIGGSPRDRSLGRAVLRNLRTGGFAGRINVVNPRHAELDGVATVPTLDKLAPPPDLVVITSPPESVPDLVSSAGAAGVAVAIIITAGLGHGAGSLAEAAEQRARAYGVRLIGPNCLGVMAPAGKLNATFATQMPRPGDLALISQSGAIAAGIIQWAASRAVGFSAIVSLGDKIDVDFGDLLDYFAIDPATRAILLYIEAINDARKFMSAARAAARAKPVVVVKAGRHSAGAKAAATHTGALAGSDEVYEAAFRRAGLLRVFDMEELFDAAETLGRLKRLPGRRVAILSNGGGLGVLAVDRLIDLGGTLSVLGADIRARLDAVLPPTWSKANPVDIVGDADAVRYGAALEVMLTDPDSDAVLVMNVPTALASAGRIAEAVVRVAEVDRTRRRVTKPILAVWVGSDRMTAASFETAKIPHYETEADAARGFMHLVRYGEAQNALMEMPPSLPDNFAPDANAARQIVERVVKEGRAWLDPHEVVGLLEAYQIPVVPVFCARDPDAALGAAAPILASGQTVVVKIASRDIAHKSDIGGVQLNLSTEAAVRAAVVEVLGRARAARPQARITGVTVHPMVVRPKARELIAGIADDPTFGPVIVFGHGGTAVEVINDKALALPPLDLKLAQGLIARTRVARMLEGYRDVPAVREPDLAMVLVKLAQLAADLPEVRELDINPLFADENGVIAVDARVTVAPVMPKFRGSGNPRFAVRPYPKEFERRITLADGTAILVRPLRPEDEKFFAVFFQHVTQQDLRLRFFAPVREFSHAFVARLTQLDYARAMAFAAIDTKSGDLLGAVRLHADANYETAEYAILVRSDLKGRGLGWRLMEIMIDYARSEGLKQIEGQVLGENTVMLEMCTKLGFSVQSDPADAGLRLVKLRLK